MTPREPVAQVQDLGELLKKRDRRIMVIMGCLAILLVVFAAAGVYIAVSQASKISDNKQNAEIAKVRADGAAERARIAREVAAANDRLAKVAEARSSETLRCLTKEEARKVQACLDIQSGRPGRDGGIGRDGKPGPQGIDGQTGAKGDKGDTGSTGSPGKDGAPGRAPTPAEIEQAVTAYCSTHGDCAGPPGQNTAVSPQQVADAVKAYCDSRGQCKGADGQDGATGADGPPGATGSPGADAPPPTQEQVTAGVAAFCAANPAACQAPVAPTPPATP